MKNKILSTIRCLTHPKLPQIYIAILSNTQFNMLTLPKS